jgi:IclR family acetate operon transcriptional repressor
MRVEKATTDDRYLIRPVLGAFRALEVLASANGPLSLARVAERAGLNKSTAFRYLRTLAAIGYAIPMADGNYEIGPAAFALSTEDSRERALRAVANPKLRDLAINCGETVNLCVGRGKRIHYLTILEGRSGQHLRAEVGDSDCFHCTALGKAMLAYTPPDQIPALLKSPLPRFTEHTIVNRRYLDAALVEVRRWGYAIDREENELGCICFAAPVLDEARVPIAAISISLSKEHMTVQMDLDLAEAIRSAAIELSEKWCGLRVEAVRVGALRSGRGRPVPSANGRRAA